jgi:hypothetical protein
MDGMGELNIAMNMCCNQAVCFGSGFERFQSRILHHCATHRCNCFVIRAIILFCRV